MDIKDIISPSEKEAPRPALSTSQSPTPSPFKYVQRAQSGPVLTGAILHKPGSGVSSLAQSLSSLQKIPNHVLNAAHTSTPSPLISPVPSSLNSPHFQRTTSTPSMDTLADLASMQNHQPLKSAPPRLRGSISYDGHTSPTYGPTIASTLTSNPRASIDIAMMDAPKQNSRTDFADSSLPKDKRERLSQLAEYLATTPSAYESHVEVIKILHDGLVSHIYPSSDPRSRRDPRSYDLLQDLRQAREHMGKLFAVGEDIWSDWIQDESLLAQTAEERIAVVEKCRQAVDEEVSSVKLWSAYADWVHYCYSWSHGNASNGAQPDEERLIGKELFTWQLVLDTWQEAIVQISQNIAQSQDLWKKYLDIRMPPSSHQSNADEVSSDMAIFLDRLQTPHLQWDETFQLFSSFVSSHFESEYEQIMMDTNRSASKVKELVAARESFEAALHDAEVLGDRDAEYLAFEKYITWERTPEKRRKIDNTMVDALYRRAELRFPSDTSLWENHATFLIENMMGNTLPLLERATKHCPWSGLLWCHYLLCSERLGQTFQETEEVKHKATSTGLLEAAGIEDVIAVHAAWCSYLRRRSTRPDGNEEDIDVAEMGIRSSIETVSSLGVKLGLGEAPGSSFRLRRVYITFLTDSERWDNARHEFDTSVRDYGKSYEFWLQFYQWEMMRWRKFASARHSSRDESIAGIEPPELATAVLKKALDQPGLDYPEPLIQAFLVHCEDHADASELQKALLKARKVERILAARRQVEAVQAAEASTVANNDGETADVHSHGSKRKRDDREDTKPSQKKARGEDLVHASVEQAQLDATKRDREHASVLVENLPEHITEAKIRQYFSNCGTIRSVTMHRDESVSAIVEYEDDDAARYALSRDGQELDGAILSVSLDTGSTLYLTNYPPSADEAYIRSLFEKYGDIVSVRFPSLQGNKRRRFCYLQFKTPSQALQATELDHHELDGLALVCKISNPTVRKPREDKSQPNDGRTIFVGQLNFKLTEDEIKQAFSSYGAIEAVRMPRDHTTKTRNKGVAFITYSDATEASSALAMHQQEIKGRKVKVVLTNNGNRQSSTSRQTASPIRNGRASSPATSTTSDWDDIKQRQICLINVPDTVNESRVRVVGEKFGKVLRAVLQTNHQGAILEYATIPDAGQAALSLDGYEIDPGRHLKVVTEREMKSTSREIKSDKSQGSKPKTIPPKAAPIGFTPPVRRPGLGSKKGGHLGQRSGAFIREQASTTEAEANGETKKSNNDFRKMINKE